MRTTVLVLAILGGLASGAVAIIWQGEANKYKDIIKAILSVPEDNLSPEKKEELQEIKGELRKLLAAIWLLFLAVPLSFTGGALGFMGKGKIGGPLLLLATIGPAICVPKTLIWNSLLVIAGGLSFLITPDEPRKKKRRKPPPGERRRRPVNEEVDREEEQQEEEEQDEEQEEEEEPAPRRASAPKSPRMVSSFTCPACKRSLKTATPVQVGKKLKCPRCGEPFTVADPEPATPAPRSRRARNEDDSDEEPTPPPRRRKPSR